MAVTPRDPRPVLLRDTHEAQEVSWVTGFDDVDREVVVADEVHRKVRDAVDVKIEQDGVVPIGPSGTYAVEKPGGGYLMHGVCIVARKAK